jgi:hypothetical protein
MGALFGPYCAFCTPLSEQPRRSIASWINALDDLRHNLAKVEVASSSLVSRSIFLKLHGIVLKLNDMESCDSGCLLHAPVEGQHMSRGAGQGEGNVQRVQRSQRYGLRCQK